ncbi:MAG TPA: CHAD domain-containing protein, partial [Acidimicrobiales bacterium]|nr:CHAD domain-containing protein [Acidimicrobiales bacterium]
RPLAEILEVRTRRRPFDLRVGDQTVAEVALDETVVSVVAGGPPLRLRRVEVEVDQAWAERLAPLVEQLRVECGLQPATLSKFEAGLLAAGLRIPTAPDLGSTTVTASPTVGDVAFAVLRRNVRIMLAHEPGTRLGEDIEDLHDMRVATRRLRAALAMFSDALPARANHYRMELGWLADVLGVVRDLDVQIERLALWADEVPEEDRGSLDELAALLDRERDEGRHDLLLGLDSRRYERLVAGLTSMLRQGPSRRSAAAGAPAVVAVPALVTERHRAAVRAARRARRSGVATDFHRLRIRGKRLRYALEFVAEVYDGETARYVRRVVRLQDALGLMQDAQVAAGRLHALATAPDSCLSPTTIFAMGGIAERYREESERLLRRLPGKVAVLRGPEWKRLVSLMDRRRVQHERSVPWPPVRRGRIGTPDAPATGGAAGDATLTATTSTTPAASSAHPSAAPALQPAGARAGGDAITAGADPVPDAGASGADRAGLPVDTAVDTAGDAPEQAAAPAAASGPADGTAQGDGADAGGDGSRPPAGGRPTQGGHLRAVES